MLERYERVLPGAAERIVRVYEVQFVDASQRDDRIVNAELADGRRGQTWAIILALICIAASIVFFARGNLVAGGILLSPPVLLLIGSFLSRRRAYPGYPPSDNENPVG